MELSEHDPRRAKALEALDGISNGEFLTRISERMAVPYATLWSWIDALPNGPEMYSRARELGYSHRLEAIEEGSRELGVKVASGQFPDPAAAVSAFKEMRTVAQWNAGKFAKGRFGDRLELAGSVGRPADGPDLSKLTDEELEAYIALTSKMEKGKGDA